MATIISGVDLQKILGLNIIDAGATLAGNNKDLR
jgi:hypothetical protein